MKKILNFLIVFSLLFIYSCDNNSDFDTEDLLTGTATEGGAIVALHNASTGKLLGIPSSLDFETATVAFAEFELIMEVLLMSGGNDIVSYEITKSLNGGAESTVATSATLPISLEYTTLDQFLDGLGAAESELRIGDVINFRTKMIKSDGTVAFAGPADGSYAVTVNCSSALAKNYDVAMHYIRVGSGIDTWYYFEDLVSSTAPGEYRTTEVGPWIGGLGVGVPGFTFTDTCGAIDVPEQNLLEFYSNTVEGAGAVDGVTGVLTIDYEICASDCRECYATYTPLN